MPATPTPAAAQAPAARPAGSCGRKDALDKFYTKPQVAAACLRRLDLGQFTRIIEPSAGSGAFSDLLLADATLKVLAFDLAPENPFVLQQDWFDFADRGTPGRTLVVGNPPFGRQSSLALRFINHAFGAVGADTVAFVLPRGFRKDSVRDRVYRHARLADEFLLPVNSFTLHGRDYNLPAVFQVWERTVEPRPVQTRPLTSLFATFIRRQDKPHFAVRRVGARAGKADLPDPALSEQTNYFLHLNSRLLERGSLQEMVRTVVELVNDIDFPEVRNGTGPNSLSKREFVGRFDAECSKAFAGA